MTLLKKSKMLRVEGIVYCHTHTEVHEDSLDPYREGYLSCIPEHMCPRTASAVHRTVYYRARKGDWDDDT